MQRHVPPALQAQLGPKPDEPIEVHFDRGTIVLEKGVPPPSAQAGLKEQGVPVGLGRPLPLSHVFRWDPRVERWRTEARHLTAFLEMLDRHGLPWRYATMRPAQFAVKSKPMPGTPLRPYQQHALDAWAAAGRRGVIALPTGSGKSRLAAHAMRELACPTLVVVPTCQLLHQWVTLLKEYFAQPIGVYGDDLRELGPVTVATYRSASIFVDSIGHLFDLLVVDEAHHLGAEDVGEIALMSTARYRLGLTATPPEEPASMSVLEDLVGPVCFSLPISTLSGTYLAAFEHRRIRLQLSVEERARYDSDRQTFLSIFKPFMETHPLAEWGDFARAAARSEAGNKALQALRRSKDLLALPQCKLEALDVLLDSHREDWKLIFTADNASAYAISRQFLLPAITCEIGREEREGILVRFKQGVYRAIVSARVLDEGMDVPAAAVAVIMGGSSSARQQVQRVGRVLRPAEGKRAIVYELVVAGTSEIFASDRRNAGVLE